MTFAAWQGLGATSGALTMGGGNLTLLGIPRPWLRVKQLPA